MSTLAASLPGARGATRRFARLAACVALSFVPGAIGSRFEPGAWYASIEKAALTPPGWVFPVVWPTLYVMMGIAVWRFAESNAVRTARIAGLALFGLQLVLNGLWSYLFFGLHRPDLALLEIVALWVTIAATIAVFARPARGAALLLVPYLAWVSFATYLNFEVWRLS